jgi:multidrug efflux pump subunit AcrB
MLEIDNGKAMQLGVSVSELLQTLQIYYGSSFRFPISTALENITGW